MASIVVGNRVGLMPSMIYGFEALLRALLGQDGPVRVDHYALKQLAAVLPEEAYLLGEILARLVVGPGVDVRVAVIGPSGAALAVGHAVGVARGVVWPERTDLLVGRDLVEHVDLDRCLLGEAPEEVVGPLEGLVRSAAPLEHVDFHGDVDGQAGHAAGLALIGHWVDRVSGRRAHHQVDLGVVDEVGRDPEKPG